MNRPPRTCQFLRPHVLDFLKKVFLTSKEGRELVKNPPERVFFTLDRSAYDGSYTFFHDHDEYSIAWAKASVLASLKDFILPSSIRLDEKLSAKAHPGFKTNDFYELCMSAELAALITQPLEDSLIECRHGGPTAKHQYVAASRGYDDMVSLALDSFPFHNSLMLKLRRMCEKCASTCKEYYSALPIAPFSVVSDVSRIIRDYLFAPFPKIPASSKTPLYQSTGLLRESRRFLKRMVAERRKKENEKNPTPIDILFGRDTLEYYQKREKLKETICSLYVRRSITDCENRCGIDLVNCRESRPALEEFCNWLMTKPEEKRDVVWLEQYMETWPLRTIRRKECPWQRQLNDYSLAYSPKHHMDNLTKIHDGYLIHLRPFVRDRCLLVAQYAYRYSFTLTRYLMSPSSWQPFVYMPEVLESWQSQMKCFHPAFYRQWWTTFLRQCIFVRPSTAAAIIFFHDFLQAIY